MFATIIIGVFFLIAVFILVKGPTCEADGKVYSVRLAGLLPLFIALLVAFLSCTSIVQAKQQGVLLTFGKPSDRTLDPGLNLKLPWQKVVTVDTTRQTDNFNDGDKGTDHGVIKARLGNGNVSSFYASVTWQINDKQANTVYGEFRGDDPTESVYEKLIAPNFKSAVNLVAGTYNPTAAIEALTAEDSPELAPEDINLAPDFDALAEAVRVDFLKRVTPDDGTEPLVKIISVNVSYLSFDEATQAKINQYQDEVQKTIIAAQAVKTAEKQADANDVIADSLQATGPDVLASRCFDLIADGAFEPPAGFSCYAGGGGSVVIPSSK